eukprot:scaffold30373_cov21-Prasinocladus_malaysianus.AAC.1
MKYNEFLNKIRKQKPTQDELNNALGTNAIFESDALNSLSADETVLCSKVKDTIEINDSILRQTFPHSQILRLDAKANVTESDPDRAKVWARGDGDHYANQSAQNIANSKGIANGTLGVVKCCSREKKTGDINGISIRTTDGRDISIRRSAYETINIDSIQYRRAVFPMLLSYAITIHRAQGATLPGKVLIYIPECFTPGLAYVAYSRVTESALVRIVTEFLHFDQFKPMKKSTDSLCDCCLTQPFFEDVYDQCFKEKKARTDEENGCYVTSDASMF